MTNNELIAFAQIIKNATGMDEISAIKIGTLLAEIISELSPEASGLKTDALVIRNAYQLSENTATRVGDLLVQIINEMPGLENELMADAISVRDAVIPKSNTSVVIGSVFEGIIRKFPLTYSYFATFDESYLNTFIGRKLVGMSSFYAAFETLCAPLDFRPQAQPTNIIDVFNKYVNPHKRYIYSLYDDSVALRLWGGTDYVIGYMVDGVSHIETVQHVETRFTQGFWGMSDEVNVLSTAGFPESGIIHYLDYNSVYQFFTYTSKTATKFIGPNQNVHITQDGEWYKRFPVVQAFDYSGKENGYIIVNNNVEIVADVVNINEALWLFVGNGCVSINAGYNGGLGGICRVKYIHYQNPDIPFNADIFLNHLGYCQFWNLNLTGKFTTPKSVKSIGYNNNPSPDWAVGNEIASLNITELTISANVEIIDNGAINLLNCHKFNFYPMIAPAIKGNSPLSVDTYGVLHIRNGAIGYDVAPWTEAFTEIIKDL